MPSAGCASSPLREYAARTRRSAVPLNLNLSTNRSGAYSILRRERKHSTLNETI